MSTYKVHHLHANHSCKLLFTIEVNFNYGQWWRKKPTGVLNERWGASIGSLRPTIAYETILWRCRSTYRIINAETLVKSFLSKVAAQNWKKQNSLQGLYKIKNLFTVIMLQKGERLNYYINDSYTGNCFCKGTIEISTQFQVFGNYYCDKRREIITPVVWIKPSGM